MIAQNWLWLPALCCLGSIAAAGPAGAIAAPERPTVLGAAAVPVQLAQNTRSQRSGAANEFAGRYGILRENNRDVGCVLSLNAGGRAQLGPGCTDHGFVVFDPIGWQAGGGKITLRARKGHRISFTRQADGTWQRDGEGVKPLGLRKY